VRSIDAVLFTHAHADHMHGIDDIRSFARAARQRIPVFGEAKVIAEIHERFAYTIDEGTAGIYRTILTGHVFDGPFEAAGVPIVPYYQDHGFSASTGFRIGNFAYSIDVKRLPEAGFAALEGITHWVVDCQQIPPHLTHSHLAQTLAWIERLKPERAVLTHMGPELDYRDLARMLPPGVEPGYDGMVLAF
jgi:phosphoribosyl 1,2-cyclic phosphate phosphodiesterase